MPMCWSALPDGAVALIQKPMGSNLAEATAILEDLPCQASSQAAVNFQLRFAPMMLALKDAIAKGWLGEVVDFDAWLALRRRGSCGNSCSRRRASRSPCIRSTIST